MLIWVPVYSIEKVLSTLKQFCEARVETTQMKPKDNYFQRRGLAPMPPLTYTKHFEMVTYTLWYM